MRRNDNVALEHKNRKFSGKDLGRLAHRRAAMSDLSSAADAERMRQLFLSGPVEVLLLADGNPTSQNQPSTVFTPPSLSSADS